MTPYRGARAADRAARRGCSVCPTATRDRLHVFVVGTGAAALGIAVDRIVGQREIVVRAIADPLVRVEGISGATDLGDGHVVLILDPAVLARHMRERPDRVVAASRSEPDDARAGRRRDCGSYILFTVAGTTYALPSGEVRHMEMIESVTRVPNAPPFVDGVVFSRGQVVPVVNLRARFGFERAPYDLRTPPDRRPVGEPRSIGLVVDSAREFVNIPPDAIQPPHEALAGMSGRYVEGIASLGDAAGPDPRLVAHPEFRRIAAGWT